MFTKWYLNVFSTFLLIPLLSKSPHFIILRHAISTAVVTISFVSCNYRVNVIGLCLSCHIRIMLVCNVIRCSIAVMYSRYQSRACVAV